MKIRQASSYEAMDTIRRNKKEDRKIDERTDGRRNKEWKQKKNQKKIKKKSETGISIRTHLRASEGAGA
jgi:hypothetical protein